MATALCATSLLAAACGSNDNGSSGSADSGSGGKKVLKIGFSGDFSGAVAPYDVPLRNGMEMAAKEINATGGADGITVQVDSRDNKSNQSGAIQAAQELLDNGDKVQVLTTVDGMAAVGQLVSKAGGIVAGGMATTPSIIHDVGDRGFSFIFSDMAQAATQAQRACDAGYKTAYLLISPEFDYTKFMPAYFQDAFQHICGGKVVGSASYKLGQTDFAAQVTKIQQVNPKPDVIFSAIFLPDTGPFLKRLRSAGVTTPFLGGDGNDSKFFIDSTGSAADGVIYTAHGAATPGSPLAKFNADYKRIMGKNPESFTFEAVGRDHVYALVDAARRAKSVEPDALLKAVLATKDLDLVTGKIASIDPGTRYPEKEVFSVKLVGEERTFLKALQPSYVPAPLYK
jgi:branched-chain amino acid transport system substrate-binding protein